jgi:hypothetical protein
MRLGDSDESSGSEEVVRVERLPSPPPIAGTSLQARALRRIQDKLLRRTTPRRRVRKKGVSSAAKVRAEVALARIANGRVLDLRFTFIAHSLHIRI